MNRTAIIAMVCLMAYTVINLLVSALVAIIWRTRAVAPASTRSEPMRARQVVGCESAVVALRLTLKPSPAEVLVNCGIRSV